MLKKSKNSQAEAVRFSFAIPIAKCYEEVTLNDEGEKVKKRFIEGAASSTDIDLHGDQMASSAIKSMAASIKKHVIGLNAEHDKSWQSDLGDVTKLSVDKKNRLIMKAELDKTSKAEDLWYALTEKKKELGLSIGGFVKDYKLEWDKKKETFKRVFKDIELDHIAVTSTPANPKTWVGAISKSVEKIERANGLDKLSELSKEELVAFVEKSFESIGEDSLKKLLTNFSLNINEETTMGKTKKDQSSLESDEAKKTSDKAKADEASKKADDAKDEDEDDAEEENQDNEDDAGDSDDDDDSKDSDESKEDDKSSDEDADDDEESDEESDDEDDDSKDKKDKKDSKESDDSDESDDEDEDKDEEKSLSRKDVEEMVDKGVTSSLNNFFSKLFGKKEDKSEDDSDEDSKEEDDKNTENKSTEVVDMLKSIVSRQDKIEKMLKKGKFNRKTVKSAVLDKEENEEAEEGVFKTLDEELESVRKDNANDPEKAFVELGKVRKRWAKKE